MRFREASGRPKPEDLCVTQLSVPDFRHPLPPDIPFQEIQLLNSAPTSSGLSIHYRFLSDPKLFQVKMQLYVRKFTSNYPAERSNFGLPDCLFFVKVQLSERSQFIRSLSPGRLDEFSFNADPLFVSFTIEVIPFRPIQLLDSFQLLPLTLLSFAPIVPPIRFYEPDLPLVSWLRQSQSSPENPPTIQTLLNLHFFKHEFDQNSFLRGLSLVDQSRLMSIVVREFCDELNLQATICSEIPTTLQPPFPPIIFVFPSVPASFAPIREFAISTDNPIWYDLISVIRDESGFPTASIYSPSFGHFYDLRGSQILRLDAILPPVIVSNELYLGTLFVRRDFVDLFRIYLPSLEFRSRFPRVIRYSFSDDNLLQEETRAEAIERIQDSQFFEFEPIDNPFPALPLPAVCGRSVLSLPISAFPVQLVWLQIRGRDKFMPKILSLESPQMRAGEIIRSVSTEAPNSRVLARVVDLAVLKVYNQDDAVDLPMEALVCFNIDGLVRGGQVPWVVVNFGWSPCQRLVRYRRKPLILKTRSMVAVRDRVKKIIPEGGQWFAQENMKWEEIMSDRMPPPNGDNVVMLVVIDQAGGK